MIVSGQAIRSCITPVESGRRITKSLRSKGWARRDKPHPLQQAFIDEQAAQCGFCMNAVIMNAKAFIDKNPKASDEQIERAMSNVLCRCFTHVRMMRAIKRYARKALDKARDKDRRDEKPVDKIVPEGGRRCGK